MNVITFASKLPTKDGNWPSDDLNAMRSAFAAELATGEASGWDTGATDVGDPQFYLLGPPPDENCILAISRLGRLYVLEDGAGHVLCENVSLERLAKQAAAYLRGRKSGLIARVTVFWAACRGFFDEKIEPIIGETEELLVHVAPQLAAVI